MPNIGSRLLSPTSKNSWGEHISPSGRKAGKKWRTVKLIDLQFEGDPEVIQQAVRSCYQEEPVEFRGYELYDPGAYPEPPLSGRITWRVTQPWAEPADESERAAVARAKALIERLRARTLGNNR